MSASFFSKHLFKLLFFVVCVFYIVLYAPYGFEITDTGYILGNAWNIYNGQLPHRDFIYTRPAIPAYFHSLFIYVSENYAYLMDRVFFYIQVFVYSYLGAKLLCEKFSIKSENTRYFLALIAALFSIHNYPPMAWNTIDGVFFALIGFYLILKKNTNWWQVGIGTLFMVLATFSKQSFYFLPLFLFGYLLLTKDFKKVLYYSLFGLLWVAAYVGFKYANGTFDPFIEQTFVRTPASGLVNAGFKSYYLAIKAKWFYFIAVAGVTIALKRFANNTLGFTIAFAILLSAILFQFLTYVDDNWRLVTHVFQFMLVLSGAYFVFKSFKDKRYLFLLLLLLVSWSASLSNGYRTPIHFSLPFIAFLFLLFEQHKSTIRNPASLVVFISSIVVFFVGYQTIYLDAPRKELTYNLGAVFPQLQFIKGDKASFEELNELKLLAAKYQNFTVLPSFTPAHYLTKTVNPMGTDWPLDVEINNKHLALEKQLIDKNVIVFMENRVLSEAMEAEYKIKPLIIDTWQVLERGTHFTVYTYNRNID